MTQTKTQIGDVTYNAATQSFEALVTFHTDAGRVRIATAYQAALDTEYAAVTDGLWHNALKLLSAPDALQARLTAKRIETSRETRTMPAFTGWLRALTGQQRAA